MLLILLLIILDQITKYFFGNIHNYGAAFSILQGYTIFLISFSFIALIICVYYFLKEKDKKIKFALMFLISGITGNLIDRVYFGYVRDFIDLKIWPVFNLADSFNVIGVFLIIYFSFKKK